MAKDSNTDHLHLSWKDPAWAPYLNVHNVLEYFMLESNPFYDPNCSNETIRMQRRSFDQLSNMVGVEYILLHAQEPILYVIRKQRRHSPTEVTPLVNYYIIDGVIYQAPDLGSIFSARLTNSLFHLGEAFKLASSHVKRSHGEYQWTFGLPEVDKETSSSKDKEEDEKARKRQLEPPSRFQAQRVDVLLQELAKQFPPKTVQPPPPPSSSGDIKRVWRWRCGILILNELR